MKIHWEIRSFGPKPGRGGQEREIPAGISRVPPMPPQPRRVSYFATVAATDWGAVTESLIQFWMKVAEVLPQYYGGKADPDPLVDEAPDTIAPDNGWDRIVCLVDLVYGKVTTNLWAGSQRPRQCDRVWIIARFPIIEKAFRESPEEGQKATADMLVQQMHLALADAADREPAKAALVNLRDWREFSLWVMHEEEPGTLRPLLSKVNT